MVGSLLVPLDGTPQAEEALPYGTVIASRTGALMWLLLVIDPTSHLCDYRQGRELGREMAWAHGYLQRKRQHLADLGVEARTQVAYGYPAHCILQWAERWGVDIIALAGGPPAAPGPWARGSVAQRVVQSSLRPVLLVKRGEQVLWPPRSILVPLDGSRLSAAVLPLARELAQALDSTLVLARVVAVEGLSEEDMARRFLEEARQRVQAELEQEACRLGREGVRAMARALVGHPVSSLLSLAREVEAGLIALSSHGAHGREGKVWPLGSVAQAIVQRSPLPCLVVRPPPLFPSAASFV